MCARACGPAQGRLALLLWQAPVGAPCVARFWGCRRYRSGEWRSRRLRMDRRAKNEGSRLAHLATSARAVAARGGRGGACGERAGARAGDRGGAQRGRARPGNAQGPEGGGDRRGALQAGAPALLGAGTARLGARSSALPWWQGWVREGGAGHLAAARLPASSTPASLHGRAMHRGLGAGSVRAPPC